MTAPLSLLPPALAATLERSYGHHRTPWFEGILQDVASALAAPLGPATPLMLTATPAGGREAIAANCVRPGQRVWVSAGSAFAEFVTTWGGQVHELPAAPERLDVDGDVAPLVWIDHVAASGALVDVERIAREIKRRAPDAVIVLDATISFGADVAEVASFGVDATLIAGEGALMGIPGLTIVAAGERLLARVRHSRAQGGERPFYFDLLRYQKAWGKKTTPYSPNISGTIALAKALELIAAHGGLEQHARAHAERARSVRQRLRAAGFEVVLPEGRATSAFTLVHLPAGRSPADVLAAVTASEPRVQVDVAVGHERRLRLCHTGYLPAGALDGAIEALAECVRERPGAHAAAAPERRAHSDGGGKVADLLLLQPVAPGIPADVPLPVFDIAPSAFEAQAVLHARRAKAGARFEQRIAQAARDTFREAHQYSQPALESRIVGFIGAGNITRHAVEKCLAIGIRHLIVYSPSLAARKRNGDGGPVPAEHQTVAYWEQQGVIVAGSADDVFTRAHTIVLLPWFYDRRALEAFGRSPEYLNEGIVSAAVLARIERDGCADVLINAAARSGFVDRTALGRAVSAGWLRYYSDELPAADDPLLELPNARFTGHVGGSCAQPQAAVARNTHRILRQVLRQLTAGGELGSDPDYRVNVINAPLAREAPWRSAGAPARGGSPVRVLITDPFDVPSLDFDRLRAEVAPVEVLDVSAEQPGGDTLAAHIRAFRPHVLMLRSRTRMDRALAAVVGDVPELSVVVRPGVGIDNVYGALPELTRLGVQIINEPFGNSPAVAEMTVHFILSAADQTLLAPGPTRVRPDVFAVTDRYEHPARPGFRVAEEAVRQRIAAWFGAAGDTVVVSGSGTALMEAGIVNLTRQGDHGLVISHGKFGDRFIEIAEARQRVVHSLRTDEPEWGRAITPDEVKQFFDACAGRGERVAFLCFQQNETSSGVAYHAPELAALVHAARSHNPDIMIIVDAISGAFAHRIDFDALDLDLIVTGSHKGLGVSSGLAYGALSRRAVARMLALGAIDAAVSDWTARPDAATIVESFEQRQRVRYLSLPRLLLEQAGRLSSDEPPSVFHVLSTLRALDLHDADGGQDAVIARHAAMARMVREGLAQAGLRAVACAPFESDSVTPAFVPEGLTASELRKQLERQYGIAIAGAQGDYWKRQMIRIGHLGFVYPHEVARCLRALAVLYRQAAATADVGA